MATNTHSFQKYLEAAAADVPDSQQVRRGMPHAHILIYIPEVPFSSGKMPNILCIGRSPHKSHPHWISIHPDNPANTDQ